MDVQNRILLAIRILLTISGASLAYLLFKFGHAEPELIPRGEVLVLATLAGICALVAGILQWAGLPKSTAVDTKKKPGKKHATGHGK